MFASIEAVIHFISNRAGFDLDCKRGEAVNCRTPRRQHVMFLLHSHNLRFKQCWDPIVLLRSFKHQSYLKTAIKRWSRVYMTAKGPGLLAEAVQANSEKKGHPYLSGNFAPIHRTSKLSKCEFTGAIPKELSGGQYVRNGGNPVVNDDLNRKSHWFDGDGMLSGVFFPVNEKGEVVPEFANQYVLTDIYLSTLTTNGLKTPITPSIATLVNPDSTFVDINKSILRTVVLVALSHLPGSKQKIKRISVGNTNILYHDGRALATCESGPPMRVELPCLETVGWFDGLKAEGEPATEAVKGMPLGKTGLLSFMKEWTTAHPKVDPISKELIMYHAIPMKPFVQYTIIPDTGAEDPKVQETDRQRLTNVGIPGVSGPKLMHDFGVSRTHTVILDLPLTLDPMNTMRGKSAIHYDPLAKARFGVFPRHEPKQIRWFETKACCIFHTANTWTEQVHSLDRGETQAVNLLACRLTTAGIIYAAGNIVPPKSKVVLEDEEEEQCRLYYFRFDLSDPKKNVISHQYALSAISLEFPTMHRADEMSEARYIYGTSAAIPTFDVNLAAKINCLVKFDVLTLIERGKENRANNYNGVTPVTGCVDTRTVPEILESENSNDPIKIFKLPPKHYAQESRFVAREGAETGDDGWLLTYVFDENQLDANGDVTDDCTSELWIIDAKNMTDVVAKVQLPIRVPYGLHGNWISKGEIENQRPIERLRSIPANLVGEDIGEKEKKGVRGRAWMRVRNYLLDKAK